MSIPASACGCACCRRIGSEISSPGCRASLACAFVRARAVEMDLDIFYKIHFTRKFAENMPPPKSHFVRKCSARMPPSKIGVQTLCKRAQAKCIARPLLCENLQQNAGDQRKHLDHTPAVTFAVRINLPQAAQICHGIASTDPEVTFRI